jgi:hypothetical protein
MENIVCFQFASRAKRIQNKPKVNEVSFQMSIFGLMITLDAA